MEVNIKHLDAMFQSFTRGTNDQISTEFIKVLFELLDKLILIFRKYDAQLQKARNDLAVAVGNNNAQEVVHAFMEVFDPLKEQIVGRDPAVVKSLQGLSLLKGVDLAGDWAKLSPRTQTVIFSYLGQLVVLGRRCLDTWKIFAPLQDDQLRKKILQATVDCEQEMTASGKDISSWNDVVSLAKSINERAGLGGLPKPDTK